MSHRQDGIEKVAKLLSVLGIELMMPIISKFDRDVVLEIHKAAKQNKNLTKSGALRIISEFNAITDTLVDLDSGIDSLLTEYDEAKLAESPEAMQRKLFVGFAKLDEQSSEKIYEIIKDEDAMYKVVILRQLSESKAQEIFNLMPLAEKASFTLEAESSGEITNEVLSVISNHIETKLEEILSEKKTNFDTAVSLASSLSEVELNELLDSLPEGTAAIIKANTLTFGDILAQQKKVIQKVFANFNGATIAAASAKLPTSELEKIYGCITSTKKEDVVYNLENFNKEDEKAIQTAQRDIVMEAKSLRSNGDIEIIK
ncbi:FliG C-terminal domain-containing protein [Vibrio crassostreae]|uniref:FliG C-terminal domain-containing protein n=1 Tax=Vibrio crassostreae TaxID=246167 RepID=UPI001B3154E7|nr:FliG C-terminal domain-containing protein [Vibrio crassostreae]